MCSTLLAHRQTSPARMSLSRERPQEKINSALSQVLPTIRSDRNQRRCIVLPNLVICIWRQLRAGRSITLPQPVDLSSLG